jgi:phosphatidylglycerophosphate synthase
VNFLLALFALIGSFMVSYAQAKGEALQVATPPGSMKRQERWTFLLTGIFLSALLKNQVPVFLSLAVVAVGANYSALKRLCQIAKAASQRKR